MRHYSSCRPHNHRGTARRFLHRFTRRHLIVPLITTAITANKIIAAVVVVIVIVAAVAWYMSRRRGPG